MANSKLVLVRHGESTWNKENRFTGWVDVPLTDFGREQAQEAGQIIKESNIRFDQAYTSVLQRANETLTIVLDVIDQKDIPITKDQALNERHYGDLQGLNKAETAEKFGTEQVFVWRRSYDVAPPNGESLKDTAARTIPYYEAEIVPLLQKGENILIAAHGNSLRSIIMKLDNLTPDQVTKLEIPTGGATFYEFDEQLNIVNKTIGYKH
ncbi:MAG: 2,3-bisphosphoglycerate-dependent phosphoglycerate mutase [Chloroflexota bacterium]|nr:2,3-bisphosphoglycerate-dependent phosphoglycerate mutase [Chloroflexota bacterium]